MGVAQPAELAIFNLDARVERACELIVDAGQAGAGWIIFPEAYLPGAPAGLWSGPQGDGLANELRAMARALAVVIPGVVSDRLCRVAQRSRVGVVIGVIERDNAICYNSLLLIDATGQICGHYRAPLDSDSQKRWTPVGSTIVRASERLSSAEDWTHVGGI